MIRYAGTTIREIGPEHAGTHFTADEFERLPGRAGYRYELIEGVLHVSPVPRPIHARLARRLLNLLEAYCKPDGEPAFPEILAPARILVDNDPEATTNPEPDIAAYLEFPAETPATYEGIEPALVVEVVSPGGHNKDYGRNPELYERVAGIMEYWVVDPTRGGERPAMTVYRRQARGGEFERVDIEPGGVYESSHWPGLRVDLGLVMAPSPGRGTGGST